jgi:hypothetical protein
MSQGKIFLIDDDGKTVKPMLESGYETEEVLQRLLAQTPELLPGDQIGDAEQPIQWLLVRREFGVPEEESGTDRWSLDHLFLDQDGIPTFVECKRSSDSRARREVVAQMLEYAANGLKNWSLERLQKSAAETAQSTDKDLNTKLNRLFGLTNEEDIEAYWKTVEKNLREGKARLIFVADKISRELKRLVEFLNEKMTDVEVLAVEVVHYRGEGQRVLVPRLIGLTEKSRDIKTGMRPPKPALTLDRLMESCTQETADFVRNVLLDAEQKGFRIYWGTSSVSVRTAIDDEGRQLASFLYFWLPDRFEVYFANLSTVLSPEDLGKLREEILSFGVFSEAGKSTLRALAETSTLGRIHQACVLLYARLPQLLRDKNAESS